MVCGLSISSRLSLDVLNSGLSLVLMDCVECGISGSRSQPDEVRYVGTGLSARNVVSALMNALAHGQRAGVDTEQ